MIKYQRNYSFCTQSLRYFLITLYYEFLFIDYKKKIGFTGNLLIEPKPKEPAKHQYDYGIKLDILVILHVILIQSYVMLISDCVLQMPWRSLASLSIMDLTKTIRCAFVIYNRVNFVLVSGLWIILALYTVWQLNIEPNHTTLAGHGYEHDIVMSSAWVECFTDTPLCNTPWMINSFAPPQTIPQTPLAVWIFILLRWQCEREDHPEICHSLVLI